MTNLWKNLTLKNIIITLVVGFFGIQIVSLLLTQVFGIPILKGGQALLLLLVLVGIISLFVLAINLNDLKKKETLIFVVIIFGLLLLAFWKLEFYFPQLFSINPEIARLLKLGVAQIFG